MLRLDEILVTRDWVGKAVPRDADIRFIKGEANYVDDLDIDCHRVGILRSTYPHARILKIDTSAAEAMPGVLAVLTGEEVARESKPVTARAITRPAVQYVMAVNKVRYVGEPVAAVVAVDAATAEEAIEAIDVDYEPLPAVVRIEDTIKENAPLIFEEAGTNVLLHDRMVHGDLSLAYQQADVVFKESFRLHRYSSTPLEPWSIVVRYNRNDDSYMVWSNDQQHGRSIVNICGSLGIDTNKLRYVISDIGGGFGINLALWPYVVMLAILARKVQKPIKWIQTRTEHLMVGCHAPDAALELELAVKKDGKIVALGLKDIENDGSFVHTAGIYGLIKFATITGCYDIPATGAEIMSVVTNQGPTVQNRGVGKPTMNFILERMIDMVARKLGISPIEMRFRNFIQPGQMPHTTPSGEIYESGDYPACLKKALELLPYDEWNQKKEALRREGKYIGVGLSAGIEAGTSNLGYYYTSKGHPEYMGNAEGAIVSMDYDGNVNVLLGSVDSGQGHATTVAQVVADMLAITPSQVSLSSQLDSVISPFVGPSGVYSNKFNDVDLGAVIMATRKVRDKLVRIGAHSLETDVADVRLRGGQVVSEKNPDRSISFKEVASIAYKRLLLLPDDVEPGLKCIAYYKNPFAKKPSRTDFNVQLTHANSVHAVVSQVDIEDGSVRLLKYLIVHDCGNQVNPGIVEGMVIGSTVHGLGVALLEEFIYDDDGQFLSSTFMDYMKPLAINVPHFDLAHMESPCPYTLLGTKAVGEGGSLTSLAAIANSVEDALQPFGVKITSLPITPEKVHRAITETKQI